MRPPTMRRRAKAWDEKRPMTSVMQHLVCGTLSEVGPASSGVGIALQGGMRKAFAIALLACATACHRHKPVESSVGSTDTVQPSTTGTTATETGGGPPVTN